MVGDSQGTLRHALTRSLASAVRVRKDVPRTDRNISFFSDDASPALKQLHNILMTYAIYNFDLGERHTH